MCVSVRQRTTVGVCLRCGAALRLVPRTHVECGLPRVSRVLRLVCNRASDPNRQARKVPSPGRGCQVWHNQAIPKASLPPCRRRTHASVGATSACICACVCMCVSLCAHAYASVHTCPRERTSVHASARLHIRERASSHAHTNEPFVIWSRPWITCVHTNEPFLIWSRPQIICAYMCDSSPRT